MAMADRANPSEPLFDHSDDDSLGGEHLDTQVQKAQEQLVSLKRQQDLIERQKRELEELSRRQEQLNAGKAEMIEKFTRAIVVLDRETYDAQKRVEQLHAIHDSFNQHLEVLDSINPKTWDGLDINKELNKALSAVDDSRAEYSRSIPKISPDRETDAGDPVAASAGYQLDYGHETAKDFMYWLKAGTAFTLPLFIVGLLLVLVIFFALSGSVQ
jgi:DNA repair exonuclease SbcCD ATPase subunit